MINWLDFNQVMRGNFLLFNTNEIVPKGVYIIHGQPDTDVWELENTETLERRFVTSDEVRKYADEF